MKQSITRSTDPRARFRFWFSLVLIAAAVAIVVVVLVTSSSRSLTELEQLLFQVFVLLASLAGAYLLGLHVERKSREWAFRQYARAAFRRVLTLYRSLTRMAEMLYREHQTGRETADQTTVAGLQATVLEQLDTIHDALEDWRDIIPEDVRDIEEKLAMVSRDWVETAHDE